MYESNERRLLYHERRAGTRANEDANGIHYDMWRCLLPALQHDWLQSQRGRFHNGLQQRLLRPDAVLHGDADLHHMHSGSRIARDTTRHTRFADLCDVGFRRKLARISDLHCRWDRSKQHVRSQRLLRVREERAGRGRAESERDAIDEDHYSS